MTGGWWLRLGVLLGLCMLATALLAPSALFYFGPMRGEEAAPGDFCRALPSWLPCKKLNLGLDLQGGVHLVMGVRVDKALEHRLDRLGDALGEALAERKIPVGRLARADDGGDPCLALEVAEPAAGGDVDRLLRRDFSPLAATRSASGWRLALTDEDAQAVRQGAVEQAIKTIRNRADKLGVTEPTIARRGDQQVLIQLPGVKDPDHAIDIIGRTAQLEFIMADPAAAEQLAAASTGLSLPAGVVRVPGGRGQPGWLELPEAAREPVRALLAPHLGSGAQLAFGAAAQPGGLDKPDTLRTWVLAARPGITGDFLTQAQVQEGGKSPGDYVVSMRFDPEGAKTFERLTGGHVGQSMAIVLDGQVVSAPTISEKISGGNAQITLGRSVNAQAKMQEARDLVLVLKAGALPAPVEVLEKRQVGKTLGQDTVVRGAWAMLVGTAAVVVFMAAYYRLSGMMANLALALNVLLMLAVLALCEATLTLPGMAGIVLTIGMAVDANVLIFERIREELRGGRALRGAIDAGYKKAFGTIFDANVTTLIAAVVLMEYGSGPVRGFAVTLIIGLSCSLYTAIVVTRLIYDLLLQRRTLTELSI